MHESTRRFVCRALFLAACLAPTLATVGWVLASHTPAYRASRAARWQAVLADRTGLAASVARVSYEAGATLLHDLELRDPETSMPIATARVVRVEQHGEQLAVRLAQGEVYLEQLPALWRAVDRHWLRAAGDPPPLRMRALQVTVRARGESQSISDVELALHRHADQPQLALEFRLPGVQMNEPARLDVVRHRDAEPPASSWQLVTGAAELPCRLLGEQLPLLAALGPESRFQGALRGREQAGGWDAEISGHFRHVDLDRLVTAQFLHKLSGRADVALGRMTFRQGRLINASGRVTSRGGTVSLSLLRNALDQLPLQAAVPLRRLLDHDAPQELIAYDRLQLDFQIDRQGLEIRGDDSQSVLRDADGPLVVAADERVSTVALIRALTYDAQLTVPATREIQPLLSVLPLPSADSTRPGYAPLRLRP